MPPKSKQFQALVREILAPAMKDLGFSRPRTVGLRGWARPSGSSWLVAWAQLNRWNYGDDPEGYSFTFEMQLGDEPVAGLGEKRERLYHLLSDAEQRRFVEIHNGVIAKVEPNPELQAAMSPTEWAVHFEDLRPRDTLFSRLDDPWLRYTDEVDLRTWLGFVANVLPGAIHRFIEAD